MPYPRLAMNIPGLFFPPPSSFPSAAWKCVSKSINHQSTVAITTKHCSLYAIHCVWTGQACAKESGSEIGGQLPGPKFRGYCQYFWRIFLFLCPQNFPSRRAVCFVRKVKIITVADRNVPWPDEANIVSNTYYLQWWIFMLFWWTANFHFLAACQWCPFFNRLRLNISEPESEGVEPGWLPCSGFQKGMWRYSIKWSVLPLLVRLSLQKTAKGFETWSWH